jgi:uncharacterized DUF497 family protein
MEQAKKNTAKHGIALATAEQMLGGAPAAAAMRKRIS